MHVRTAYVRICVACSCIRVDPPVLSLFPPFHAAQPFPAGPVPVRLVHGRGGRLRHLQLAQAGRAQQPHRRAAVNTVPERKRDQGS